MGLREALAWLLRRRTRYRVGGRSMLPTLEPDDEVLIAPRREARVGDVVVARHPFRSDAVLIKRLDAYDERGNAVLLGDNPTESTDSRTLGAVPPDRILGPVTSRF